MECRLLRQRSPLSHEMTYETFRSGPSGNGSKRVYSFLPLYKKAPLAAPKHPELYELLGVVDALRDGGARERELGNASFRLGSKDELPIEWTTPERDGGDVRRPQDGIVSRYRGGSSRTRGESADHHRTIPAFAPILETVCW